MRWRNEKVTLDWGLRKSHNRAGLASAPVMRVAVFVGCDPRKRVVVPERGVLEKLHKNFWKTESDWVRKQGEDSHGQDHASTQGGAIPHLPHPSI
jgi:hypothetical protein